MNLRHLAHARNSIGCTSSVRLPACRAVQRATGSIGGSSCGLGRIMRFGRSPVTAAMSWSPFRMRGRRRPRARRWRQWLMDCAMEQRVRASGALPGRVRTRRQAGRAALEPELRRNGSARSAVESAASGLDPATPPVIAARHGDCAGIQNRVAAAWLEMISAIAATDFPACPTTFMPRSKVRARDCPEGVYTPDRIRSECAARARAARRRAHTAARWALLAADSSFSR